MAFYGTWIALDIVLTQTNTNALYDGSCQSSRLLAIRRIRFCVYLTHEYLQYCHKTLGISPVIGLSLTTLLKDVYYMTDFPYSNDAIRDRVFD